MDQLEAVIREKILRFHESASRQFPIRKVLLYGSYAKGRATPQSDIDVAVVVDEADHTSASTSPRRSSTGQPRSIRR